MSWDADAGAQESRDAARVTETGTGETRRCCNRVAFSEQLVETASSKIIYSCQAETICLSRNSLNLLHLFIWSISRQSGIATTESDADSEPPRAQWNLDLGITTAALSSFGSAKKQAARFQRMYKQLWTTTGRKEASEVMEPAAAAALLLCGKNGCGRRKLIQSLLREPGRFLCTE